MTNKHHLLETDTVGDVALTNVTTRREPALLYLGSSLPDTSSSRQPQYRDGLVHTYLTAGGGIELAHNPFFSGRVWELIT